MTSWEDSSSWRGKRPKVPTTGLLSSRTQLRLGRMATFAEQVTNGFSGCDTVSLAMETAIEAKGRLLVELLIRQERRMARGELD